VANTEDGDDKDGDNGEDDSLRLAEEDKVTGKGGGEEEEGGLKYQW